MQLPCCSYLDTRSAEVFGGGEVEAVAAAQCVLFVCRDGAVAPGSAHGENSVEIDTNPLISVYLSSCAHFFLLL